jgi:type I site-specific restriction endonuclease
MKPEEKARQEIDQLLEKAGWKLQDYEGFNFSTFAEPDKHKSE